MVSPPAGPRRTSRRLDRSAVAFTAVLAPVAAYLLLDLPYRFPPTGPLVSPSLVFGFNNRVAIGGVIAIVGAAVLFRLWRSRGVEPASLPWFAPGPADPPARIRRTVFALMIAAHAGLVALMWIVARTSNTWRLDFEASHFLWRLHLMTLFGARPYIDFQHEYGPALLYGPLLVYRLLAPLGVTLEAAYYLSYLGGSVLGLAAILSILDRAQIPRPRKEVAFCLLAAAGLTPYMGLNGNLVRYLPPYLGLVLADQISTRARGLAVPSIVVCGLGALTILISPEIGVAFGLGWITYCAFIALGDRRRALSGIVALAAAVALTMLAVPSRSAGSILSFSSGAANFPLVPAPHIVFYLIILVTGVSRLVADGVSGRGRPRALLLALATVSVVMIPGALSRADPPHVLFFSLGVHLLFFVQTALDSRRAFIVYAGAFALVLIGGLHLSNARAFYDVSLRHLRPAEVAALARRHDLPEPSAAQLARLDTYRPLGLPFCSYGTDRRTMAHLWAHRGFEPEYYCGIIGVYSAAQLDRKLADTRRHEYVLVQREWLGESDPCERHRMILRRSFVYPRPPACRREGIEPDLQVSRELAAHYRVVEAIGPYVVMRRGDLR